MSDIFVSYDDEDRPRVRPLVQAFETRGWSVWWDQRISTGERFPQVIERELEAATCVVVVWTTTSVHSEWVRAEADAAWKRRKLVPVLLDRVKPPMPFGQILAADLFDWSERGHDGFVKLTADLQERIGKAPAHVKRHEKTTFAKRFAASKRSIAIAATIVLLVATIAWYQRWAHVDRATGLPNLAPSTIGLASFGAYDPSGHWQAQVTYADGASFEERFTFEVAGRQLSGTASMRGYGYRRGILDGTLEGNRLSFHTTGTVQLNLASVRDVTYVYRGTHEGDTIRFTIEEKGSGDPAVAFTATRISAEQASRIATGGTRPRLSGMETGNLYAPEYVRNVVASRQTEMEACYEAAEFDEVNHEFVDLRVSITAAGAVQQFEMRPEVASLEPCLRNVLSGIKWGPTRTGSAGTVRVSLTARLPWNP